MLWRRVRSLVQGKSPGPVVVEVNPHDAAGEPIDTERVAEIMQIIVHDLQVPAPAGLTCRCGASVATGCVYCYRDEFFCSEQCCKSAVEKQQRIAGHFFRSVKREEAR